MKMFGNVMFLLGLTAVAGCAGELGDDLTEEELASVQQTISCSGNGCNGLDPAQTPCASGSVTIDSRAIYRNGTSTVIGLVELRWSPSCQTNWARVSRSDGAYAEGMYATIRRNDGLQYTEFLTGYSTIWSDMVYAPSICAKASGLVDQSHTSGSASTGCW